MKQLALDFAVRPRPTLDNFIEGRNAELLDNLRRVASRGDGERFLYLWGRSGTGRSHLLKAVVAAVIGSGASAAYVDCGAGLRSAEELSGLDCVALDDVDRLGDAGQIAAFDLYNSLREGGAALIASGAAPPVQLALREDLVTRLAWGLVYQVHSPTDEDKARAVAEFAALRGFRLLPEVRDYLLRRASRDLSSLMATVEALDRYSMETKRPVTVPLAREILHAAEHRQPAVAAPEPGSPA